MQLTQMVSVVALIFTAGCAEKGDTGEDEFEPGPGACVISSTVEDYSACVQGTINDPSECGSSTDELEITVHMGDDCADLGFPVDCGAFAPGSWTATEADCDALLATLD